MMDRAHQAATKTAKHPDLAVSDDEALPLSGNDPLRVYVRITNNVAEFSSDKQTWVPKRMSWECGDEYALYITYVLTTTGIELVPPVNHPKQLWFSPVLPPEAPGDNSTQLGSIPPVVGTFHFRVQLPPIDGHPLRYIDPQIVVTPINGGDD